MEKRIVIADLHIGDNYSQYKHALAHLTACKEIIILGDCHDRQKGGNPQVFHAFLHQCLVAADKVIYVMGNHEWMPSGPDPEVLLREMRVCDHYDITLAGLRYRFIHGHQYDFVVAKMRWLSWFSVQLQRAFDWCFGTNIKRWLRSFKCSQGKLAKIEAKCLKANENHCDVLVMGHTHRPDICLIDNTQLVVAGDFIEHSTWAVIEDARISLVKLD